MIGQTTSTPDGKFYRHAGDPAWTCKKCGALVANTGTHLSWHLYVLAPALQQAARAAEAVGLKIA